MRIAWSPWFLVWEQQLLPSRLSWIWACPSSGARVQWLLAGPSSVWALVYKPLCLGCSRQSESIQTYVMFFSSSFFSRCWYIRGVFYGIFWLVPLVASRLATWLWCWVAVWWPVSRWVSCLGTRRSTPVRLRPPISAELLSPASSSPSQLPARKARWMGLNSKRKRVLRSK